MDSHYEFGLVAAVTACEVRTTRRIAKGKFRRKLGISGCELR